ncbi:MAG: hypothetical protein AABX32_02055 [Nanoarchaeota archaeon]
MPARQLFVESLDDEQLLEVRRRFTKRYSNKRAIPTNRKLRDLLESNRKLLQRLNVAPEQLADRIDSLVGQAKTIAEVTRSYSQREEYLRAGVALANGFRVSEDPCRCQDSCPFSEETRYTETCGYTSRNYGIQGKGEEVTFTALMPHLLRDHHFTVFHPRHDDQGALPLEYVVRALDVKPGVDYTPKRVTLVNWVSDLGRYNSAAGVRFGPFSLRERFPGRQELVENPDTEIEVAEGVTFYRKGDLGLLVCRKDNVPLPSGEVRIGESTLKDRFYKIGRLAVVDPYQLISDSNGKSLSKGQLPLKPKRTVYIVG